jgi:SAM-dependent methyltransferase
MPLYSYWCGQLREQPRFHRKQWEYVYICQVLHERGFLRQGREAIGFGVGREPLPAYFANRGVRVLATDQEIETARDGGWVSTSQHTSSLHMLDERGLCDPVLLERNASFRAVDMNRIPEDLGQFDFCWSSCAFEHLGSINNGLEFVLNSAKLLKPGGIAVHTTEYNVLSNEDTIDNNPNLVIFRRRDIERLVTMLGATGYRVEPIDYWPGEDQLEQYVDLPPYLDEPHLRLELAGKFVSTSLGIVVQAP